MDCPKCSATMELVDFRGIEIDRCTRCFGLWFDRMEAETLRELEGAGEIDIGREAAAELNDQLFVECPKCYCILDQNTEQGIKYEFCLTCHGTFFDAGEFRDYLALASKPKTA